MDWQKLIDLRCAHLISAAIAKGIGKKLGIQFATVKNDLYYTCNSYDFKKSGLSLDDYYSQGIMEYRLIGTTGLTAIGRVIYVDKSWNIGVEGYAFEESSGRFVASNDCLGDDFIKLVSLKTSYITDNGTSLIWGENMGARLKAPNQKTIQQKEREAALDKERQEHLQGLLEAAVGGAVKALSRRGQEDAQRLMEEGMRAAERARRKE